MYPAWGNMVWKDLVTEMSVEKKKLENVMPTEL